MTPSNVLCVQGQSEERKRLGQFFTGERLARLLAALAEAHSARAIIDPMGGCGDMLIASRQVGAENAELTAVEIDPLVAARCAERLQAGGEVSSQTVIGDAFSPETWSRVAGEAWDLVITNPPYVRYQRTAHRGNGRVSLPSARDVQRGLTMIVQQRTNMSRNDREVFRALASGYSGLADLAVPAWLLCASLVSAGGRLAMVVPDTWLSRNYTLPVLYLLRRFFKVECVIDDGEAAWFDDALVRTSLLIARRVADRGTALSTGGSGYVHVRLDSTTADARSVVGRLYPASESPERDFTQTILEVRRARGSREAQGVVAKWTDDGHFADLITSHGQRATWIFALESNRPSRARANEYSRSLAHVPREIREALGRIEIDVRTLGDYGWQVGQGLRTGCNRFFYAERIREQGTSILLAVDPRLRIEPLWVPSTLLRTVVRNQRDLPDLGTPEDSPGRVFVLSDHALPEDIDATVRVIGSCPYEAIPNRLARHVQCAAVLNVGTANAPRRLQELSAVVTNVRLADPARPHRPPRFWYQLPPFSARHVPELFIPRINHLHAFARLNPARTLIDANFSTMWRQRDDALPPEAMLALFHSTWILALIEASATVLGGGALKVEATQLRRMPLPSVRGAHVERLAALGTRLTTADSRDRQDARRMIDEIIWQILLGKTAHAEQRTEAIHDLALELKRRRSSEDAS